MLNDQHLSCINQYVSESFRHLSDVNMYDAQRILLSLQYFVFYEEALRNISQDEKIDIAKNMLYTNCACLIFLTIHNKIISKKFYQSLQQHDSSTSHIDMTDYKKYVGQMIQKKCEKYDEEIAEFEYELQMLEDKLQSDTDKMRQAIVAPVIHNAPTPSAKINFQYIVSVDLRTDVTQNHNQNRLI